MAMIGTADKKATDARRKAEELLSSAKPKDSDRLPDREKARQQEEAKTARLRELRLAKEAAEKLAKRNQTSRRKPQT
jgi:hypothetical protein